MARAGRGPIVVLWRDVAIPRLRRELVAPCTTTIRGRPRPRFECDDTDVAFRRLVRRQEQRRVTELVPVIAVADRFVVGLLSKPTASDGLDKQQV